MKKWILFAAAIVAALSSTAAALQLEQRALADKLVRLHVVANSDTEVDQQLKLQVRDAVLAVADGLNEAELYSNLLQIKQAARDCLRSQGSSYTVDVSLRKERFPTRVYESFSLPAGVYQTLRVTIGDGAGKNWWCVAFPSICFRASVKDLEAAAVSAGFTQKDLSLITQTDGYILKFWSMEQLERLKVFLFKKLS